MIINNNFGYEQKKMAKERKKINFEDKIKLNNLNLSEEKNVLVCV